MISSLPTLVPLAGVNPNDSLVPAHIQSILPLCFHLSNFYQNSVYSAALKFYLFFSVETMNGI